MLLSMHASSCLISLRTCSIGRQDMLYRMGRVLENGLMLSIVSPAHVVYCLPAVPGHRAPGNIHQHICRSITSQDWPSMKGSICCANWASRLRRRSYAWLFDAAPDMLMR